MCGYKSLREESCHSKVVFSSRLVEIKSLVYLQRTSAFCVFCTAFLKVKMKSHGLETQRYGTAFAYKPKSPNTYQKNLVVMFFHIKILHLELYSLYSAVSLLSFCR